MPPMIEAGARGGAIAVLVLLAGLLLRDGRRIAAARCGALFAAGAAASLVAYAPPLATERSLWLAPLRALAFASPAVFWTLADALFDDQFALSWRYPAAALALEALGFWAVYGAGGPRPYLAMNALALVCLMAAMANVFAGQAGDLVEGRRRLRLAFVAGVGLFIAAVILAVTWLKGGQGHPAYGVASAGGALAVSLAFAAALLSLTPGALFEPAPGRRPARLEAPPDPREATLLAALTRRMDEQRAWRDERLNIAGLAAQLGTPEYRLRRLINQRLGHRNFAAFLNAYRLAEVRQALADPDQAQTPILTIALDAGFNSIGAFNRAFKAETAETPSAYRRRHAQG